MTRKKHAQPLLNIKLVGIWLQTVQIYANKNTSVMQAWLGNGWLLHYTVPVPSAQLGSRLNDSQ